MNIEGSYIKNKFELSTNTIISDDNTFIIKSDKECDCILEINYYKDKSKTLQLIKAKDNIYRTRYKITNQDLNLLTEGASINLIYYANGKPKCSNIIVINFDYNKIYNTIKLSSDLEIQSLKKKVAELESMLYKLQTNKGISTLPNIDTSYSDIGAVPVLATKDGTFVLKHLNKDAIDSVCGIYPEDGDIQLYYNNIKIDKDKTLVDLFKAIDENFVKYNLIIKSLNEYINTLKTTIKTMSDKLIELELRISSHISNPIV